MSDPVANEGAEPGEARAYRNIGALTRMLHDTLRELGLDRAVESAIQSLPDARARLDYIVRISGEAAERVIGQVEVGKRQQAGIGRAIAAIEEELRRDPVAAAESGRLQGLVATVRSSAAQTDGVFTEILMAQSFHDLTSQVIQKVAGLVHQLEAELVRLLIEMSPEAAREGVPAHWLNGPVIEAGGRPDAVSSQEQVDDLLESLGF